MPIKKGQITNPKGANGVAKKQRHISDMLMHLLPKVAVRLERMLDDPDHVEFASKMIIEHVCGKPAQSLDLNGKQGITFRLVIEGEPSSGK